MSKLIKLENYKELFYSEAEINNIFSLDDLNLKEDWLIVIPLENLHEVNIPEESLKKLEINPNQNYIVSLLSKATKIYTTIEFDKELLHSETHYLLPSNCHYSIEWKANWIFESIFFRKSDDEFKSNVIKKLSEILSEIKIISISVKHILRDEEFELIIQWLSFSKVQYNLEYLYLILPTLSDALNTLEMCINWKSLNEIRLQYVTEDKESSAVFISNAIKSFEKKFGVVKIIYISKSRFSRW